jgi:polyisoprenoid-binding protein YceI
VALCVFLLWGFALVAGAWAQAPAQYTIDQHVGSIGFSVRTFGMFWARGKFRRFSGTLSLNLARPERTQIAVTVEADSIAMPWEQATQRLKSPAYFDVARYKVARFNSNHVVPLGPNQYRIEGTLEIRGISEPQTVTARLVRLASGPTPGTSVADFVVTGEIRRSDFGMTADRLLVANVVHVDIHARIILRPSDAPG